MPPRKRTDPEKLLDTNGAAIGEAVPTSIVDASTAAVGIPPEADRDPSRDLDMLRRELDQLQKKISRMVAVTKSGSIQAARQTEATVKLYPISSLLAAASVAAAFAFAVSALRSRPPRTNYERMLEDLTRLTGRVRSRL